MLLRYDEDSAGGLMGKELCSTKMERVLTCKKAENVSRVHSIYVVDDEKG
jgi:magnesium transporter